MEAPRLLSLRKVGVCGSSKGLKKQAIAFCGAIGDTLAKADNVVIVSGGTKLSKNPRPTDYAAEWYVVSAAERTLRELPEHPSVNKRIVTVVTDEDSTEGNTFRIGTVRHPRGKTREARRFSFVRRVDALMSVAGRGGTAQELALAMELELPVLPVPMFGGASKEYWDAYRKDLIRKLRLDAATIARWEQPPPKEEERLRALASEMVRVLLASLPRRCFVIIPFRQDFTALYDFVIKPAIRAVGDEPIHLERLGLPGEVGTQIRDGINGCDYAIVVLDGLLPNVFYETGLAHAAGKPTVLLHRVGALDATERVPFDLSMHQRLEYQTVGPDLLDRLQVVLATLLERRD